jgi:hypothetical protein
VRRKHASHHPSCFNNTVTAQFCYLPTHPLHPYIFFLSKNSQIRAVPTDVTRNIQSIRNRRWFTLVIPTPQPFEQKQILRTKYRNRQSSVRFLDASNASQTPTVPFKKRLRYGRSCCPLTAYPCGVRKCSNIYTVLTRRITVPCRQRRSVDNE